MSINFKMKPTEYLSELGISTETLELTAPQVGKTSTGAFISTLTGASTNDTIYVAGQYKPVGQTNPSNFALSAFNNTGAVDNAFGGDGAVVTSFSGSPSEFSFGSAMTVDENTGRIYLSGDTSTSPPDGSMYTQGVLNYGTICYKLDGSLDSTWGTGGKVVTNISTDKTDCRANTVYDSKVYVGGGEQKDGSIGLVRYNFDGSLDTSFGTGGIVKTLVNPGNRIAIYYIYVDELFEKIYALGSQLNTTIFIARYEMNGDLDITFGTGGIVTYVIPGTSSIFFLKVEFDDINRKFVMGYSSGSTNKLIRINTDGSLDTTFNNVGYVTYSQLESASALKIDTINNKIYVAGTTPSVQDLSIGRFNYDGTLDTSFPGNGFYLIDTPNYFLEFASVIALINNNIYVGGNGIVSGGPFIREFLMIKLHLFTETTYKAPQLAFRKE